MAESCRVAETDCESHLHSNRLMSCIPHQSSPTPRQSPGSVPKIPGCCWSRRGQQSRRTTMQRHWSRTKTSAMPSWCHTQSMPQSGPSFQGMSLAFERSTCGFRPAPGGIASTARAPSHASSRVTPHGEDRSPLLTSSHVKRAACPMTLATHPLSAP